MKRFKLYQKVIAIAFALFFVFQTMSQINSHAFSNNGGVYICGPSDCLDQSPNHLSYYCDNFHQLFWEVK